MNVNGYAIFDACTRKGLSRLIELIVYLRRSISLSGLLGLLEDTLDDTHLHEDWVTLILDKCPNVNVSIDGRTVRLRFVYTTGDGW